jgi:hypothetical protein
MVTGAVKMSRHPKSDLANVLAALTEVFLSFPLLFLPYLPCLWPRRSDTDGKLAQLRSQEQQLLELLAKEHELSSSQRVQLLEQLGLWEKKRAELEQEEKMMLPQVRTFSHSLQTYTVKKGGNN